MAANQGHYNPNASQVGERVLQDFVHAPLSGQLKDVPGIGPGCVQRLDNEDHGRVTNSHQLIGKFLSLKPDEDDPVNHCQRFYIWLERKGVSSHRNTIVQAIGEKASLAYPGLHNPALYPATST